jgi:YidC/Oxa1 family membrane protein insertase
MNEQRSFILAIVLSISVLVGWQFLVGMPQMEEQQARQEAAQRQAEQAAGQAPAEVGPGVPTPGVAAPTGGAGGVTAPTLGTAPRGAALAASPRLAIATPSVEGSIALRGARIDDLKLLHHRVSVAPGSPFVTLLSPTGSEDPFYVEHGWSAAPEANLKVPNGETMWTATVPGPLTPDHPVILTWDNGSGLVFRRSFAVDDGSMFTVTQSVANKSGGEVTLFPYALVSRHGTPKIEGFFILHEGLIGYLGEEALQEVDYDDVADGTAERYAATGGWLGITDKYWAAVVVPAQDVPYQARFTASGERPIYQADYLLGAVKVADGGTAEVLSHVFAGAKRVNVIDGYGETLGILRFDKLVDWGWFEIITKPLFLLLDYLNGVTGNFGVAILIATVLIKALFFPLANMSYVSMSRMKGLQPEMMKLRERYKDDRVKQQQELMALYKKQKVNPMAGCWPIAIQIPVFFALYKVLFVSIEMRHQPFFGWIQDLSAPDPTSLFNLFGLVPWDPPSFLLIGIWPLIMGATMFIQMRLNPLPADPVQQQVFTWMPLLFTFLLAGFASGLVIYWAWNNSLSVLQQYVIMRRQGVKVDLLGNIAQTFRPKKDVAEKKS